MSWPAACIARLPAPATVLADPRGLLPAEPGDPLGDPARAGARSRAGHRGRRRRRSRRGRRPGRPTVGRRPRTGAPLLEEAGLRGAGVGVGDDEGVDGGGAQQVVVPVERVLRVAGEQQHVVPGARGGLDQAVQEAVHQRVAGALLGRLEAQPEQVRGAGAQLAGGPVGRVAEPLDDRLDADAASRAAAARGCSARWTPSGARRRLRRRPWPASGASPAWQVRPLLRLRATLDWLMRSPRNLDRSNCVGHGRRSTSYPGTVGPLA